MKKVSQETNIAFIFLGVLAAAASMLLKDFRPLLIVSLTYIAIVTWVDMHSDKKKRKKVTNNDFKSGIKYSCFHTPTMETWLIIGVSNDLKKVCAGGWPPSIADMSDCIDFEEVGILDEAELRYREKTFGTDWL